MSEKHEMPTFSAGVEHHVAQFLFERAQPLLLQFDENWQLVNLHGDPARFGFDPDHADAAARQ